MTNTFVRNTGDDGLAMWAENVPNVNNSFTLNTVGVTLLANNIVIYGGRDIKITDNVVADSRHQRRRHPRRQPLPGRQSGTAPPSPAPSRWPATP